MLRGICRCLHYFYIVDCYCRVGRHFQRRSLLVSSCPQSAFGLTGGLLNGSSFRAVLCSGFAAVCILQTVIAALGDTSSVVPCWFLLAPNQPSA